jgi:hypothetical protein
VVLFSPPRDFGNLCELLQRYELPVNPVLGGFVETLAIIAAAHPNGIVILLSMFAMGVYMFLLPLECKRPLNAYKFLFWTEWIAVWSFAAAWLTKGRAMVAEVAVDLMAIPGDILSKRQ